MTKLTLNGIEPDGCEYASVTKRLGQNAQIQNFKQCNGRPVTYIGPTGVEALTEEAKAQLKSMSKKIKASCKLQNQAMAQLNEFTLKCFKNPMTHGYKWIILKHGKFIQKAPQ